MWLRWERPGMKPLARLTRRWEDNMSYILRRWFVRVNGTGSGSCPLTGFGISGTEHSVTAVTTIAVLEVSVDAKKKVEEAEGLRY